MKEDEDLRTIYCANLHEKLTEALLYELFLQVSIQKKKKTNIGIYYLIF